MSQFAFIFWGLLAAFATSLVFAAVAAFLGREAEFVPGPRWGTTLGVGLGYLVGHGFIREWFNQNRIHDALKTLQTWVSHGGTFPFFAGEAVDWLPWIVVATMIFAILDGRWPTPRWARWENRLLLIGCTIWLLLNSRIGPFWEPGEAARWMVGLGIGLFVLWVFLDARAEELGTSMPLILIVPAIGLAISELLAGTYVYFGLAGILAAIIGGLWVVSWFSPRLNLSRTVIPIYSLVYGGLIVCGLYFAELPRVSALALAVTPLASLIDRLGFFANLGRSDEEPAETRPQGFAIAAIRVAAMLVPIAVAIIGTIAYGPQRSD